MFGTAMSKRLSLLPVLFFAFCMTIVAARPRTLKHRSHPTPTVDISHLGTNSKRFAAGLPPLPPLRNRNPTLVNTARRATNSQCAKSGVIQVINANTNVVTGYLSKDLRANQRYDLATLSNAGTFSSSVFTTGQTMDINILDATDTVHYLAGLVKKSAPLGDGLETIGNKDPSINNRDTETAIWTYNRVDDSLTATWFNYPGQTPATATAYFSYIANGDKFYLTNTPTPPSNGISVLFKFISVSDQCGS